MQAEYSNFFQFAIRPTDYHDRNNNIKATKHVMLLRHPNVSMNQSVNDNNNNNNQNNYLLLLKYIIY